MSQRFCPVPGCTHIAKRLEALGAHLGKMHGDFKEGKTETDERYQTIIIVLTIEIDATELPHRLKISTPNTVLQSPSLGTKPQTV